MFLFDRLLRRLGTATAISFSGLLQPQQRSHPRIDLGGYRGFDGLGPDTWATLRTQGDHRDCEKELVTHQIVENEGISVVVKEVGVIGARLDLFVRNSGVPFALDRQRAYVLAYRNARRVETSGAGNVELGRHSAAHNYIASTARNADVELPIAPRGCDVGTFQRAAQPRGPNGEPKMLSSRIEVMNRDGKLGRGHGNPRERTAT
jgi:hypothetical protein